MKNIGVIVTIALAVIAGAIGYGATKEKVKKVEKVVERVDEKVHTIEKLDVEQTILIQQTTKQIEGLARYIEKLNEKIDRELKK